MTWLETLRTAYEALNTRRLRSLLTVLGILIGIAAVILTVGLGQGASQKVTDQINKLGSNLLIVSPGSVTSASGVRGGRGSATTLTVDDAVVLSDPAVAPDIASVAPTSQSSVTAIAGNANWTTTAVGTTADWLTVRVGRDEPASRAQYFLDSPVEMALLLERMLTFLTRADPI